MTVGTSLPIDWTNGTGVFPAGGSIALPANTERQWLHVQNRDLGEVLVTFAVKYANGGSGTISMSLDPAAASGKAGGVLDEDILEWVTQGQVTISGTAGQSITVLTG